MADAYFEIEEYLWFTEYQQGNVNVAGLVFDDLVQDSIDMAHEVYTVWVDQIDETFGIAENFTPYHQAFVGEQITFYEWFGTPLRVRQSVVNLIMTSPLPPAQIAHVHLDILHGPDTYWEEVSSELQAHSSYANAVPYYWDNIFESLEIDMTEPQPEPPIIVAIYPVSTDLVNMRHIVEQEYLFNSKCYEAFFAWDGIVWGWNHRVDSPLGIAEAIKEAIGKLAEEYLYLMDATIPLVNVSHLIDDRVFIFDVSDAERFYLLMAVDTIAILEGDDGVSFRAINTVGTIGEILGIRETAFPQTAFMGLATESLVFTDIDALVQEILIQEGLDMGDVELARWVFNVLIESGCDIADVIG